MKTTIYKNGLDCWILKIENNGQVFRSWSFDRLIEALDMASLMQIHVDNVSELQLSQYALHTKGL